MFRAARAIFHAYLTSERHLALQRRLSDASDAVEQAIAPTKDGIDCYLPQQRRVLLDLFRLLYLVAQAFRASIFDLEVFCDEAQSELGLHDA
ncbi:MAG: hypothetical protein KDB07_08180, partial [Planctomycetes bacterium]|nr:hypothetical protein [Planctomycetota bacterium]